MLHINIDIDMLLHRELSLALSSQSPRLDLACALLPTAQACRHIMQSKNSIVIAWMRSSTSVRLGREEEHVGAFGGGEKTLEFLPDGVSRKGTSTVHVWDMIPVLELFSFRASMVCRRKTAYVPSSTSEIEGGCQLTFFDFVITI